MGRATSLCRAKDDEQVQVSGDVVESMDRAGRNEDDVAGLDCCVVIGHAHPTPPRDDVIDLVLRVWRLVVDSAGREDVEARAEVIRMLDLEVGLAGCGSASLDPSR